MVEHGGFFFPDPSILSEQAKEEIRRDAIAKSLEIRANKWLLHLVIPVQGEPAWIVYETTGFDLIITTETEADAREMADKNETREIPGGIPHPWLSKEYSTATRLN